MEKPSSDLQLALSSLAAMMIMRSLVLTAAFAGFIPRMAWVFDGMSLAVAVLFLPLLWWRHKVGYLGSVAYGIWSVINVPIAFASGAPLEVYPVLAIFLIVSLIFVVSAYRASREKV